MIWDFAAVLTLLVLVSGLIWAGDALLLAPRRRAAAAAAGSEPTLPLLVDYAKSFFPIFLVVLLLRSFLVEPFRIPSGSMIPTLVVGDFILVNKYTYGIRLPVLNRKIVELGAPERGDVVVFRYPLDPSTPFIKRIVGLPGDHVVYRDKHLYINGEEVERVPERTYVGVRSSIQHTGAQVYREQLGDVQHEILITPGVRTLDGEFDVPPGHYFVLGDNRDNSRDSRYWGYVPDENLVGRAFFIWFHWDGGPDFGRVGNTIE
ncbi:MAG: signal peptidase I [Gammaproteobacteria bacterium]|nr:signal peptidase I [Gammaproteobacteria bacterium]MCP5198379.1 signal peptidase I [Gammaproteobacteria bacterium]